MDRIVQYVIAAEAHGLSYGKYVASLYDSSRAAPSVDLIRRRHSSRKFDEQQAFSLWQQYMTDLEIAKALGVSRGYIQEWRSQLALPSTSTAKKPINTKKYRLSFLRDGTVVVIHSDEL